MSVFQVFLLAGLALIAVPSLGIAMLEASRMVRHPKFELWHGEFLIDDGIADIVPVSFAHRSFLKGWGRIHGILTLTNLRLMWMPLSFGKPVEVVRREIVWVEDSPGILPFVASFAILVGTVDAEFCFWTNSSLGRRVVESLASDLRREGEAELG